ncbi:MULTISPECIES: hypothetical protein [Caballeronia]|uniref:Uncharacterized protein n=1 Tax=Caballeronia jiangsuensis TaxID=1458357 RepID=A0ABW9CHJ4_9BURK|nr:hypothetical protein [Caballeronia sp. GaOx3]
MSAQIEQSHLKALVSARQFTFLRQLPNAAKALPDKALARFAQRLA